MLKTVSALLGAVALTAAASAQDDLTERERLALEMMELSGAADMANTMVDQMMPMLEPSFRQGYPGASDAQVAEALAIFSEAFRARNAAMNREMAELYVDHLTAAEMRAVNEFYRSEAGQSLLAAMPEVMVASQAIGERMAVEIMAEEGERMEAVLNGTAADQ